MTKEVDSDRLSTGVVNLDQILDGGLPRYSVIFVAGLPGTGKTILSQQSLFANARQGKTSLYFSTISEPPVKVLRFLQGFSFFQPDLFASKVIYSDLGGPLRKEGPAGMLKMLDQLVRQHHPALVVIDSFKAIRDTISDPLAFREFTSDLAVHLAAWEVTSLFVGEYTANDVREGPEFAIADGIFYLYGTEEAEKQKRYLRIMKMRGTAYREGEHFFTIGRDGVNVYPRMATATQGEYAIPCAKIGSAIEGMTEMLGGGIYESTATLISGATGSGKTLMALSFLMEAARQGQPGLLASFEETEKQLARNCRALGWDLDDLIKRNLLTVFHVSPSELNIDHHAFAIRDRAEQVGAKIVAIDSISAFEAAVADPAKYQSYLWAINDYFKRQGVTVVMTTESKSPFDSLEISTAGVSFVSDNIIFVRYIEEGSEVKRVVGVLKMRGSGHDRHIRELLIGPDRIAVGPALEITGMLGGTARR